MFTVSKTLFSLLTCIFYTVIILFVISGPCFTNGSHGSGVLMCYRCFGQNDKCGDNNAGASEPAPKDGYCYVRTAKSYSTGLIQIFRSTGLESVNINYTVANSCQKLPGNADFPETEYNYTECRCNHENQCNKGEIKPPPGPTTTTPEPIAPPPAFVKIVRARGSGSLKFGPQFLLILMVMIVGRSFTPCKIKMICKPQ